MIKENKIKHTKCGYEWKPKKDKPKQCPYCKAYIKYPKDE